MLNFNDFCNEEEQYSSLDGFNNSTPSTRAGSSSGASPQFYDQRQVNVKQQIEININVKNDVDAAKVAKSCLPPEKIGKDVDVSLDISGDERFYHMPEKFKEKLDDSMTYNDTFWLVKSFDESDSTSWDHFASSHLNISPEKVENIREEKERPAQIQKLFDTWRAEKGKSATLRCMAACLEKAELIGTKFNWWNNYRDESIQQTFNEKVADLRKFVQALAVCAITETEWGNFLDCLNVKQFQKKINLKEGHEKIRQRINIILFWVEKHGYKEATIEKLHQALKKVKLRRVICQISDPAETYEYFRCEDWLQLAKSSVAFCGTGTSFSSMNEQFIHLLEDEWDYIFDKLPDQQRNNILSQLKPPDQVDNPSIDEAFSCVLRHGNDGFHKFAKALSDEFKGDLTEVCGNYAYTKLFNLKKCHPPAAHFKVTEGYKEMERTMEEKRYLELHGLPGSGKSQCASKFADEFVKKYPMSIVWFLDCRDEKHIDDSLLSLTKTLVDSKICTNNKSKDKLLKDMCSDIRKADIYVFFVFEDLRNKIRNGDKLSVLLNELRHFEKAFVLATPRKSGLTPPELFSQQKLTGFTDNEALKYMLQTDDGGEITAQAEVKAAEEIIGRYSNLPLGIAPAKAYCEEKHLNYEDYLQVLDEELEGMEDIQSFQDEWINESESDTKAGKNIFATMIMALQNMEKSTLSNQTVDYQEVFSHAMYFHHEKIPAYLFKQIIMQADLLSEEVHNPVSEILCKIAINDLLKQLEQSSLGVVDFQRDVFASTVSTHRVVLEALKHISKRDSKSRSSESKPKLLNALHALTCYCQKDNRLSYQYNVLLMLMPHVSSALSMINLGGQETREAKMLEKILYIKLLELKGFACTQTDAISDAVEPLATAYEELIKFLCVEVGISDQELDKMVRDRATDGNERDNLIKLKAKLLTQHCQSVVMKIPKQLFSHLARTVAVNQADIELLKRNAPDGTLQEKIIENHPLSRKALEWLRRHDLALSEKLFQETYLAELLASVAYTRGRLMFYKEFEGDREEHINFLKLSYYITNEVFANTGVRLLHNLISQTNGLLYLNVNKGTKESYEFVYGEYKKFLNTKKKYFEHGVLKEDGLTPYNQMRCYKQMIRVNHKSMELPGANKDDSRFEVCRQLKQLIHDNRQYAKTAVDSLVIAGNFCKFGERYELALEIYREMMDRVNNEEEMYAKKFIEATMGFSDSALKLFNADETAGSRREVKEAKQRCDKARILLPRNQRVEDIKNLSERLEKRLRETEQLEHD